MIYNGDVNGQDIVTECNDLANSTNTTFPLNEKTRAANKVLAQVWSWILESYNGWQLDDSVNTDFPIATASLQANQADYDIPTGSQTIRGVEILSPGNTLYSHVYPITEEEITSKGIAEGSVFSIPGTPLYYRPIGTSIKLYPTPSYSQAASLRVTFDRGLVNFVPTDTTKQPGFASQFHNAVPLGMALDYAIRNNLSSYQVLKAQMDTWEKAIKNYYSKRYQEQYPNIMKLDDLTQEYI